MTLTYRIATVFGIGHLRPAPGTWGSAAAILVGLLIDQYLGAPALVIATLVIILAGFWACRVELSNKLGTDPSEFVIDEVAGQWIALLAPALAFWSRGFEDFLPWPAWVSAFLTFRLFDIWKPWLVGRADARGDADGVMIDDLWAGFFAGIAVFVGGVLYHGVFLL
ncbi:MAG: phosphatidylglycerophosphatase A [Rhodobacteraceae bacterium]|jgi:phosphatidylglycerophosphatase A|nr:phosphatidylglycerophosphatase A [Paracoccaceae bacterium]